MDPVQRHESGCPPAFHPAHPAAPGSDSAVILRKQYAKSVALPDIECPENDGLIGPNFGHE
ncbi:hypothetical protein A3C52_03590 [Candidatus Peribacteria bacterium RIFCSPHIGHO2_02_FULL_51_15]|nr:MAG: hypothetical protein A3C52_03590 [Candidatus Peribacteria bacterium RIFCSPHIGHO2_02_FULL_51_15]